MRRLALALGLALWAGCSPNPPSDPSFGDGFFGCATGPCPSSVPYCDPVDQRCYAEAPTDAGPRPDAYRLPGTGGRYDSCGSSTDCMPGSGLTCVAGACMTACMDMTGCTMPFVCAPPGRGATGLACVQDCISTPTCPVGTRQRTFNDMGRPVCHCVPEAWPL